MNHAGVMIICAHPDDHVIGAGGTIAKYSAEGKKVISVVCSYGEGSHPWLKERVVRKVRKRESEEAAQIVGIHRELFLGLKEGKFGEGLKDPKIQKRLKGLIRTYRVKKIFTHSIDDPHPDHSTLARFVLELTSKMKSVEVFSFNVWNPFIIRRTTAPRMYVDITNTFHKKIKALKWFRSQNKAMRLVFGGIFIGALINGLRNGTSYAEGFVKLK